MAFFTFPFQQVLGYVANSEGIKIKIKYLNAKLKCLNQNTWLGCLLEQGPKYA